ncbi:MAG: KpsF/GutQ family sugar-phosphate isomerase [Planctomycetota bacterium]
MRPSEKRAPSRRLAVSEVLELYARSLLSVLDRLDTSAFERAVELMRACRGMVVVTGMGKAGIIGQKISATLASTGTRSFYLHPADAVHGDLGRVQREDVVVALSNSGTSHEIVQLLDPLKRIGAPLIVITGNGDSALTQHADVVLLYGRVDEACSIGLVPTTSTMLMLAIGDALAIEIMDRRQFSREEFAMFHPAGDLGRKLLRVDQVMRRGEENPTIAIDASVPEALAVMTTTKGKPGAVSVINRDGTLAGIYTDGDFRRNMNQAVASGDLSILSAPILQVMTRTPKTIGPERLASEAMRLLREHRIDQVPVVDEHARAIGLLDVQDLLDIGIA